MDFIKDGVAQIQVQLVLVEVAGLDPNAVANSSAFAKDLLHERRLANAVFTDEEYTLTAAYFKVHIFIEGLAGEVHAGVPDGQDFFSALHSRGKEEREVVVLVFRPL